MTTLNIPFSVFYFLALLLLITSLSRTKNTANSAASMKSQSCLIQHTPVRHY